MTQTPLPPGQRGPADHERREQIIRVADEYIRRYGYNKTTVADLAKEIGVSTAYLYRFFASKQAIGEAICALTLGKIETALRSIAESEASAAERIQKIFTCMLEMSLELFFEERKLHEIVIVAVQGRWCSSTNYKTMLLEVVRTVIEDGRRAGEFENATPLDEVCAGVLEVILCFFHPLLLQQEQECREHQGAVTLVSTLVLRSLRR